MSETLPMSPLAIVKGDHESGTTAGTQQKLAVQTRRAK
jgi:hypothetical protein